MAKIPAKQLAATPQGMAVYYLIDDKIDSPKLGDVPVQHKGTTRFVVMNEKQAEYWIDQSAIALEEPTGKRAAVVQQQMIGEGDDTITKRKGKS